MAKRSTHSVESGRNEDEDAVRFWHEADRLRQELRHRPQTDSTEILRQDREASWRATAEPR